MMLILYIISTGHTLMSLLFSTSAFLCLKMVTALLVTLVSAAANAWSVILVTGLRSTDAPKRKIPIRRTSSLLRMSMNPKIVIQRDLR